MSIISLQEIMLVLLVAIVIIALELLEDGISTGIFGKTSHSLSLVVTTSETM